MIDKLGIVAFSPVPIQSTPVGQAPSLPDELIARIFEWLSYKDRTYVYPSLCRRLYQQTHGVGIEPGNLLWHISEVINSNFSKEDIAGKLLDGSQIISELKSTISHMRFGNRPVPFFLYKLRENFSIRNQVQFNVITSQIKDIFYVFWHNVNDFQIKSFNRIENHRKRYQVFVFIFKQEEYFFGTHRLYKKTDVFVQAENFYRCSVVNFFLADGKELMTSDETNRLKIFEEVVNRAMNVYVTRIAKQNLHFLEHLRRHDNFLNECPVQLNCNESGRIVENDCTSSKYAFSIELCTEQWKGKTIEALYCRYENYGSKISDLLRCVVLERTTTLLSAKLQLNFFA